MELLTNGNKNWEIRSENSQMSLAVIEDACLIGKWGLMCLAHISGAIYRLCISDCDCMNILLHNLVNLEERTQFKTWCLYKCKSITLWLCPSFCSRHQSRWMHLWGGMPYSIAYCRRSVTHYSWHHQYSLYASGQMSH